VETPRWKILRENLSCLSIDILGMTSVIDFHGSRLSETKRHDVSRTCHADLESQHV
jgi:hypothetical protein